MTRWFSRIFRSPRIKKNVKLKHMYTQQYDPHPPQFTATGTAPDLFLNVPVIRPYQYHWEVACGSLPLLALLVLQLVALTMGDEILMSSWSDSQNGPAFNISSWASYNKTRLSQISGNRYDTLIITRLRRHQNLHVACAQADHEDFVL